MVRLKRAFNRITLGILISAASFSARAEVLFEGYSKILVSGQHVGFVVQRYEFDSKKKEFKMISYLKTNKAAGDITESSVCRSTSKLKPISFQYTNLTGDTGKLLDGTFKGDTMTLVTKEKGTVATVKKKIPKDMFLSSFLGYLMLQGKEGIKPGVRYAYKAIAEEDGNGYNGDANITAEENVRGVPAFKVLNTFKGEQFISYVTAKGEVLSTSSPVKQVSTELVANSKDATTIPGVTVNTSNLSLLFGNVPRGTENVIARKSNQNPTPPTGAKPADTQKDSGPTNLTPDIDDSEAAPPPTSAKKAANKKEILEAAPADGGKKSGVPGGKGVMIKMTPTPDYEGK